MQHMELMKAGLPPPSPDGWIRAKVAKEEAEKAKAAKLEAERKAADLLREPGGKLTSHSSYPCTTKG